MALLRIKNPEQLKQCKPGEIGRVTGLDRIPEVRCLRSKLQFLTSQQQAVQDVDLEEGIIRLRITKGSNKRFAVLSGSMHALLKEYADKTFYLLGEDDFIFSNRKGSALRCDWLEEVHSRLLCMAGIPSASAAGNTKRLHDWRHTYAVGAFKQMVERGHDMYLALPILSAYMGHVSIKATERYLRLAVNLYPYLQKKFDATLEDVFGKEVHCED